MDKLEQNIINKLQELKFDYNSLKPTVQGYLKKIEELIITEIEKQQSSIEILKRNKVNISSIAEELGLSRTTFYNNSVLKAYIEYSEMSLDESNPIKFTNELKASKSVLQAQVNKMIVRDINSEILINENKELKNSIKEKNKEIKRLQNRNAELSVELQKIKTSTSNKK